MSDLPILRYAALGDSLAAGMHSYVPLFAQHLQRCTGHRVRVDNFARGGFTSAQILAGLRGSVRVRDAVAAADVVTVNGGGNDLLPARVQFELAGDVQSIVDAIDRLAERLDHLLREIVSVRGSARGVVTMDLYQPFVAAEIQAGTFETMAGHLRAANARLRAVAAVHGIPVAGVHLALNGDDGRTDAARAGYLWLDGIHPSAAGARAIADALGRVELPLDRTDYAGRP